MARWRCIAGVAFAAAAMATWSDGVMADGSSTPVTPAAPAPGVAPPATATPTPAATPTSPEDAQAAEVLFQEARKLVDAGKFALACPKFAASQKLAPAVGTLLNLADCYQQNGQTASAWVRFVEAQAAAKRANRPEREKVARERAAALEPKLSRLNVTVAERETPGLEVKRDGFALDPAVFGTAVPVDPGKHTIDAEAPGRKKWSTTVDAAGATTMVKVPVLEDAGEARGTTPTTTTTTGDAGSGQRIGGIIVLGIGVVGLAFGTVFGLNANSSWQEAQTKHCAGTVCDAEGVDLAEGAKSSGTLSTLAFIGGGVFIAGGAALYFMAPSGKKAAWQLAPSVGPRAAGLSMGGSF